MDTKYQDCGVVSRPPSPAEEAFCEIETALKILAEAVDRIGVKTSDVRYCRPCDPCNSKDPCVPSGAPLLGRLHDIKSMICRQADVLNNLSDEIQL